VRRFYFDHNATTPVSPEVLEAIVPVMAEVYGNASSIHHFGQAAKLRLDGARRQIAALLGADPKEVVFTSGGTEADNLAIFGVVRHSTWTNRHVITTTIEHPAVMNACAQLEREGVDVSYVPVGPSGIVDPEDIRRALRPATVLVSVMHANNEIGTVQPLSAISAIAHEVGALLHSDGVQAAGKVPANVRELGVDLYSISGHKIYAPKGVGALYVRDGVELVPLLFGGHHERDRRAGTENVPGAVGLGCAAEWMLAHRDDMAALSQVRDYIENAVLDRIPGTRINCAASPRVPNTTNIAFEGIDSEPLLIALDLRGYAVSSGSACSSGASEPSHVLKAIGLSREAARSCLRISVGRFNTIDQAAGLVDALETCAANLRRISVHA
jgi:cysteine desulfurase